MPIGLLMLTALSVIVSRHAKELGRSRGLWVPLLWVSCFSGGYVFTWLAVLFLPADQMLTAPQVRSSPHVPAIVGMILGAVAVVLAVNRPRSSSPQETEYAECHDENI
jgi:sugar phosphate permease